MRWHEPLNRCLLALPQTRCGGVRPPISRKIFTYLSLLIDFVSLSVFTSEIYVFLWERSPSSRYILYFRDSDAMYSVVCCGQDVLFHASIGVEWVFQLSLKNTHML